MLDPIGGGIYAAKLTVTADCDEFTGYGYSIVPVIFGGGSTYANGTGYYSLFFPMSVQTSTGSYQLDSNGQCTLLGYAGAVNSNGHLILAATAIGFGNATAFLTTSDPNQEYYQPLALPPVSDSDIPVSTVFLHLTTSEGADNNVTDSPVSSLISVAPVPLEHGPMVATPP